MHLRACPANVLSACDVILGPLCVSTGLIAAGLELMAWEADIATAILPLSAATPTMMRSALTVRSMTARSWRGRLRECFQLEHAQVCSTFRGHQRIDIAANHTLAPPCAASSARRGCTFRWA